MRAYIYGVALLFSFSDLHSGKIVSEQSDDNVVALALPKMFAVVFDLHMLCVTACQLIAKCLRRQAWLTK